MSTIVIEAHERLEKLVIHKRATDVAQSNDLKILLGSILTIFIILFLISVVVLDAQTISDKFVYPAIISFLGVLVSPILQESPSLFLKLFAPVRKVILKRVAQNSSTYKKQLQILHDATQKIADIVANGHVQLGLKKPAHGQVSQEVLDDFRDYLFARLVFCIDFDEYKMQLPKEGVKLKVDIDPEGIMLGAAVSSKLPFQYLPKFTTIRVYTDGTVKYAKHTSVQEGTL
jgi:hypothetical protein